jgi:DNA (cytosine-5)-methyltransferase 1
MIYLIDLFCGAGGVSTGASMADGVKVIACVNHDSNAIKSHQANHPECIHYTEDIKNLDLSDLSSMVTFIRLNDQNAIIGLWASLECTNFSRAKGGLPRDADSRTLAEHLFRYFDNLDPDIIYIENVEEFMSWGPLDENGRPISKDKGIDYLRWVNNVKNYGYKFDYKILNSADYGAYQTRKRYFAQFAKEHLDIYWPEQTHSKKGAPTLFGKMKKWMPVKDVLKLHIHGRSIFGRKKNLSDKTYERIYAGLIKFVGGGKESFLLKYNSVNGKTGKYVAPDMENPSPTVSTQGRLGVVSTQFLSKYFSGSPMDKNISIDEPSATVKPIDNHSFITTYYGNGDNVHDLDKPAATLRTKDSHALIESQFIQRDFSNGSNVYAIDAPAGTVMPSPKMNLVSSNFLIDTQYGNTGRSIEYPAPTLIARMDKKPQYLVLIEDGCLSILIEDEDTPHMILIKKFMSIYGIIDIQMRMLDIDELLAIQGFPSEYKLMGTQTEQKKYIGNAVEVTQARVILEASASNLLKSKIA